MLQPHARQFLATAQTGEPAPAPAPHHTLTPQLLTTGQETEALAFLSARQIHTVIMAGLIRDNGLVSPLNRGTFYGCRDRAGQLEGVALVGHAVLAEAQTDAALAAFAAQARACPQAHLIMGEEAQVARFWQHYASTEPAARHVNHELLYVQHGPAQVSEIAPEIVPGLRTATTHDLEAVLTVHAHLVRAESGINPLEVDPEGFRARTVRRIERGRVWVWIEEGRVIYKTDVVSETPEVIYLEGVYVHPAERGRGYGLRCLSQLSRALLGRTSAICLLVNEENVGAQALYRRAGYRPHSRYSTIFLRP